MRPALLALAICLAACSSDNPATTTAAPTQASPVSTTPVLTSAAGPTTFTAFEEVLLFSGDLAPPPRLVKEVGWVVIDIPGRDDRKVLLVGQLTGFAHTGVHDEELQLHALAHEGTTDLSESATSIIPATEPDDPVAGTASVSALLTLAPGRHTITLDAVLVVPVPHTQTRAGRRYTVTHRSLSLVDVS